jgi:hypothetical protein
METRPSAAHRWTKCTAAPQFSAAAGPRPPSDDAREGTCAAWVAEQVLTGRATACRDMIGATHENGWQVDAEMAGHVQDYVDLCHADDNGAGWAEIRLTLSDRVAGTADWLAINSAGQLVVRDLKYGFRLVEPDSPQLVIYAAAALQSPGWPVKGVVTEIFQPRGFHPLGPRRQRRWTTDEIRTLGQEYAAKAEACHQPNPTATPGPHCLYCEGSVGCAALQATAAQTLAVVEMQGWRERTPAEMAQALHFHRWASDTITAAAKALEAEAEAVARSGTRLPGWGLSPRLGNTRVTAPPALIAALTGGTVSGEKTVPMGVADLKAAGMPEATLKLVTERPVIGHKLTPLSAETLAAQFNAPPTMAQE